MEAAGLHGRHPSGGVGWRAVDALIALRRGASSTGLSRLGSLLSLLPALALAGLLVAGLAVMASRSVHSYDTFLARQGGLSLEQYGDVFENEQFREVMQRTVLMALVTTTVALTLAVPFAITMARTSRRALRLALLVIVFLPVLTGDITRTYGWLVVLEPQGPLSWAAEQLGLGRLDILGTLWAVGIGTVQVQLPIAVLVMLPGVVLINQELENAARTLGASPRRVFTRVVLPQLRGALVGAAAVCFALAMTEFANPQLLGQGVRDYVGNLLYATYLGNENPARGAAIGLLMLATVAIGVALILAVGRAARLRRRA
jgi:ABC-type spermidine/putrescine transport system permease subunit I